MFKIEHNSDGRDAILRLSGRIKSEHLEELNAQIESGRYRIVNLTEVKLVDRDVVVFFGRCESNGIELRNCTPYIREWILREKARDARQ